MTRLLNRGASWAGLASGPAAWALSTQGGYALVPWQCEQQVQAIPVMTLVLAALSLGGGFLSWRARSTSRAVHETQATPATERFVATVGMLISALFALVILMQGAAALVLDGCLR